MKLVMHPPGKGFEKYNMKILAGQRRTGKFGLAFDIWQGWAHLFRSYTGGESIDDWGARNFPQAMAPDFKASAMGMGPHVSGIDRFDVPTWDDMDEALSLPDVVEVLQANLSIAAQGHSPNLSRVPNHNAIRQRLHNVENEGGWCPFQIFDSATDVAIRAIVAPFHPGEPDVSSYVCDIAAGEDAELGQVSVGQWTFDAESVDMREGQARRGIVRTFKSMTGTVGRTLNQTHVDDIKLVGSFVGVPYTFEIRRDKTRRGKPGKSGGFTHEA